MNRPYPRFVRPELAELQTRLERWRAERRRREPIPSLLWEDATKLARTLGVSAVGRALRLSYPQLKRRAEQAIELEPSVSFVALPPLPTAPPGDSPVRIEVTDIHGATLRLTLSHAASLDPATLVHAFLRGTP